MKYSYMFVYGTLRKEGSNNYLLRNSEYVGLGKTREMFSLYVEGIPYLNPHENICKVVGEVYKVDNKQTLPIIDMLEGHPRWYYRFPTQIVMEDNTVVTAWTYFNSQKTPTRIDNGDFIKYIKDDKKRIFA